MAGCMSPDARAHTAGHGIGRKGEGYVVFGCLVVWLRGSVNQPLTAPAVKPLT